jgi:hypothetical protein
MFIRRGLLMTVCVFGSWAGAQNVLYVNANAAPGGNGTSWATAYRSPAEALAFAAANPGSRQVWIAAGTYRPDATGADVTRTFTMVSNVTLLGGFAGTESEAWQRDASTNITILSGEYAGGARAYRVLTSTSVSGVALSGLTIRGGRSVGHPTDERGSGMRISGGNVTLNNCIFIDNGGATESRVNVASGGGVAISGSATVTLVDCRFENNAAGNGIGNLSVRGPLAGGNGGALSVESSTLTLTRCIFAGNRAGAGGSGICSGVNALASSAGGNGGGVWASASTVSMTDCKFIGNMAGAPVAGASCPAGVAVSGAAGAGGGVFAVSSPTTLLRCEFIGNRAQDGLPAACDRGFAVAAGTGGSGGAIQFVTSATNVLNSAFIGNSAGAGGAGFECNSTPIAPGAHGVGGAIAVTTSTASNTLTLVNCTLTSNSNRGGNNGAGLAGNWRGVASNNIFWNNGLTEGAQIVNPLAATLRHNTVQGWTGVLGGTNNNGTNPQFIDLDGANNVAGDGDDNIILQRTSPLIDSGRNADVSATALGSDLAGLPRLLENAAVVNTGTGTAPIIDRGAHENSGCVNDCDSDGACDDLEILSNPALDCNMNGVLDQCEVRGLPQLSNPGPFEGDGFGFSVDADRGWLIVGERFDEGFAPPPGDVGAAHAYQRVGGQWIYRQRLVASDGGIGDQFGNVVSIFGEWAFIAARFDDVTTLVDAGGVYVFRRQGGVWTQSQILRAADAAAGDQFGHGVSVDGSLAVIGAINDDDRGSNSGSAYIYRLNQLTNLWSLEQKITAPDGGVDGTYGLSVAMRDISLAFGPARAVVGAIGDTEQGYFAGAVYVYSRGGNGVWGLEQKLVPDRVGIFQFLGEVVAIDGNTIVASARGDTNQNIANAGCAYVFEYSGGWEQAAKLYQPAPAGNFSFAFYTAIGNDGALIAVGSPLRPDADGRPDVGGVDVFTRTERGWGRAGELLLDPAPLNVSEDAPVASFGYALAIEGTRIVAGAYNATSGTPLTQGAGWVRSFDAQAIDCNRNGVLDQCERAALPGIDSDGNTYIDECEYPVCTGDFNSDGGIDGADVQAFFDAWSNAQPRADVNDDGGVDGGDIDVFFALWASSSC